MEQPKQSRISSWLSGAPAWQFSIYAMGFAFLTYFCMYAFRKPFGAATFEGLEFLWGIKLKTAFVVGQIIGYTQSKYYGCKYCSEIGRSQQAKALVLMIVIALFTSAVMFFLCYHSYGYIETLYGRGRILPALGFEIWWIYIWAPVGFAITGIQYFLTAIKNLTSRDVYLSTGVMDGYADSESEV